MIEIRASKVLFYSQIDEDNFLTWIKSIASIKESYGDVEDIILVFKDPFIPDFDLRELMSLYSRYDICMKDLKLFLNDENSHWFLDKKMYWFSRIFN